MIKYGYGWNGTRNVCVELSDTHNKICKMHFNARACGVHTQHAACKRFDMRNSYLLNVVTAVAAAAATGNYPDKGIQSVRPDGVLSAAAGRPRDNRGDIYNL